jgi:hypothetical protein
MWSQKSLIVTGGRGRPARADREKDLAQFPASRAEELVRREFRSITGRRFPTVYPSWLDGLELDGYNEELMIAFEFQGPQHTKFDPQFDRHYHDYYERVLNDQKKLQKCKENGVYLVIIDYIVPRHLLNIYIRSRLHDMCKVYPERCGDGTPLWSFSQTVYNYMPVVHHDAFRDAEKERGLDWVRKKTGVSG